MLKNAYLGAKIGFDTEENELSEAGCAAGYQLYFYLLSSTQRGHQNAERNKLRLPTTWTWRSREILKSPSWVSETMRSKCIHHDETKTFNLQISATCGSRSITAKQGTKRSTPRTGSPRKPALQNNLFSGFCRLLARVFFEKSLTKNDR